MCSANRWYLYLIASVFVLLPGRGTCDEPEETETTGKYPKLVEQLASPNKRPEKGFEKGDSFVRFPKGYDREAQERIATVRKTLADNIEEALPALIAALDDKRYCMTTRWQEGDTYFNESVGSVCEGIIASHLEVYFDCFSFSGPTRFNSYRYNVISKEWYSDRQDKSLVELQIEAIDWAIEKRKAEPEEKLWDRSGDELTKLQKLRDDITKSSKPVERRGIKRVITADEKS